jgi:hypothetical protein
MKNTKILKMNELIHPSLISTYGDITTGWYGRFFVVTETLNCYHNTGLTLFFGVDIKEYKNFNLLISFN